MTNEELAINVLEKAKAEIIRELASCGQNGGVGRVQNYAPIFNNLCTSLAFLKEPVPKEENVDLLKAGESLLEKRSVGRPSLNK